MLRDPRLRLLWLEKRRLELTYREETHVKVEGGSKKDLDTPEEEESKSAKKTRKGEDSSSESEI